MKKVIMFVLVFSMLFCGTFSSVYVSAEENGEGETEYLNYELAYTPSNRVDQGTNTIGNRAIIGDDSRLFVEDVSVSPYCKIVYIRSFFYYNNTPIVVRSTGFILGPDLIVMAGHALFGRFKIAEGHYEYLTAESCSVYLEMEDQLPSQADAVSTEIYISEEYLDIYREDRTYYDWGYIIVDEPVGHTQGWFGFGQMSERKSVSVAGYPQYFPEENRELDSNNYNYNMCHGTGIAMPHPYNEELLIRHNVDTAVGQSGSPIYDADQIVWGIHVLGFCDINGDGADENNNVGIRINAQMFQLLKTKKQEGIARWG